MLGIILRLSLSLKFYVAFASGLYVSLMGRISISLRLSLWRQLLALPLAADKFGVQPSAVCLQHDNL